MNPHEDTLTRNLEKIRNSIEAACRHSGRASTEIELMAVTKTHPASAMEAAAALGIEVFGENRVQEFEAKRRDLQEAGGLRVHLIGHLQSNKVARAVEIFSAIDTVDSLRLALRLNDAARRLERRLPVLLEIKLSPEEAKSGVAPGSRALEELLERLPDLPFLSPRGLLTVPPFEEDPEATRPFFRRLRELRDQLSATHPRLDFQQLSMGMSHDFPVAIEEGATQIRLGTALFGSRAAAGS